MASLLQQVRPTSQGNVPRRTTDVVEATSRTLGAVIVAATVLGGSFLLFSGPEPARAARSEAAAPARVETPPPANAPAVEAPSPIRRIPLKAGVDATPAAPPKAQEPLSTWVAPPSNATPVSSAAPAAPVQPAPLGTPTNAPLDTVAAAPTACLTAGLTGVLRDVEARFGPVTLVSTTELHTDNHARGSARHKLHEACRAVDFKVKGNAAAVTAYLRSRPEVAGINVFRNNGVIHIDASETRRLVQR